MPVRVDPSGRRFVRVEVQVQGPIHRVWSAVATDHGISAWFAPTSFELGPGKTPRRITFDFGPGSLDAVTVTAWNPPHSFAVESTDFIPGGPPVTTKWNILEASNETCEVRVQHQVVVNSDAWDAYLEDAESGWPEFFENLKSYLSSQIAPEEPATRAAEANV